MGEHTNLEVCDYCGYKARAENVRRHRQGLKDVCVVEEKKLQRQRDKWRVLETLRMRNAQE